MARLDDGEQGEEKARPTHATDHLANERTFLAWIRTSLAVIALGFAVAKFGTWLREIGGQSQQAAEAAQSSRSLTAGLVMIAVGGVFAVIAWWRYRVVGRQIEAGTVRPDGVVVGVATVVLLVLALVTALLVVQRH